ncbi:hypothetical protein D3C73_1531830 [compost metagenome]
MYPTVWVHKKFISDLNHFNKISDIALIIKQNKNKKALIIIQGTVLTWMKIENAAN